MASRAAAKNQDRLTGGDWAWIIGLPLFFIPFFYAAFAGMYVKSSSLPGALAESAERDRQNILSALQKGGNGYELNRLTAGDIAVDDCQVHEQSAREYYEVASLRIGRNNHLTTCQVFAVTNGYRLNATWVMERGRARAGFWPWGKDIFPVVDAWIQENSLVVEDAGRQLRR